MALAHIPQARIDKAPALLDLRDDRFPVNGASVVDLTGENLSMQLA